MGPVKQNPIQIT